MAKENFSKPDQDRELNKKEPKPFSPILSNEKLSKLNPKGRIIEEINKFRERPQRQKEFIEDLTESERVTRAPLRESELRGLPLIPRKSVDEARREIRQFAKIADVSGVREKAYAKVAEITEMTPDELVVRNRNRNLNTSAPFRNFISDVLESGAVEPVLQIGDRFNGNSIPVARREIPTPTDIVPAVFKEVFSNNELLDKWMGAVDTQVKESSAENIKAIDQAAETGDVVKKDIVLVGGGPLTSLAASILGPYANVTVITEQKSIGKPWRNRPMYINSSTDVKDPNGLRLPLLDGTTTPVSLSQQLNNLDTDVLLGRDTKDVTCSDGSKRKYVSGIRLGKLIATEIAFNTDDYLVEQTVGLDTVQINNDGSKRLTLTNREGETRKLDASAVIFLTGPGEEKSVLDGQSAKDYKNASFRVDATLKKAREAKARGEEIPALDIPSILTLTSIEKLHEFWVDDLNSNPEAYPFKKLLDKDTTIANIGGGDTTRVLKEFVDRNGPLEAYPKGFLRSTLGPTTTLYNESIQTSVDYQAQNRRRYSSVFNFKTQAIREKAKAVTSVTTEVNGEQREKVIVSSDRPFGFQDIAYDFAFVATGLKRANLRDNSSVPLTRYFDPELTPVGLGNSDKDVYVAGTAAGFTGQDFPSEIQGIIQALGIRENTVSLWANGLLGERLLWSVLEKRGASREKIAQLRTPITS